jgi:hypothetical protein
MVTYKNIQDDMHQRHRITVKTCWIADVKRQHGKISRKAHNRINPRQVKYPCPPDKRKIIEESMRRLGVL